jgi:serine/threonine-protein kinase
MPWTRPEREPAPPSAGSEAAQAFSIAVFAATLIGALAMARRNVTLGRGDRAGATRLGIAIAVLVLVALVLEGHHQASTDEIVIALRTVCWVLFAGVYVWALYLALEPPIRRRWPHTLIAWNRLLTGRVTDPLVGRSLLLGAAIGSVITLVAFVQDLCLRRWSTGAASAPTQGLAGPLLGTRIAVSWTLLVVYDAIFSAFAVFFLIFLLRLVLRKNWLAACGWGAIIVAQNALASASPWGAVGFMVVVIGALMYALFLEGILCFVVASLFLTLLTQFPVTSALTAWYGAGSVAAFALLTAIALYGFRTALAGKSLLGMAGD